MSSLEQPHYESLCYGIVHWSLEDIKTMLDDLTDTERRTVLDPFNSGNNGEGLTPLHHAIVLSRDLVARLLIDNYEVPVDQMSNDKDALGVDWGRGGSTLWWAAALGNFELTKYLLDKGATIDKAMDPGETPLHASIRMHQGGVARFLLQRGADPDIRDKNGYTAFLSAVKRTLYLPIKYLIESGINVDQTVDSTGDSALHLAACNDDISTVTSLIRLKANPSLVNNAGLTPLTCAAYYGKTHVYRYLDVIQKNISPEERVTGLELFAASFALSKTDEKHRFDAFCSCIRQALRLREENALDKHQFLIRPMEHYNGTQECVTEANLQCLSGDSDRLVIEGLLILERTLGADHALTHRQILSVIKGPDLVSVSLRFKLYVRYCELTDESLSEKLSDAGPLLGSLKIQRLLPSCKILQSFMESICRCSNKVRNMEYNARLSESESLLKAMFCAVTAIQRLESTDEEWIEFILMTKKFCAHNLTNAKGYTLMHIAVDSEMVLSYGVLHPRTVTFFDIDAVQFLAKVGCNLNTPDNQGNTPLYIAVQHTGAVEDACKLVEVLFEYGALADSGTRRDATAFDLCKTEQLRLFLRQKIGYYPSLIRLAARVIRDAWTQDTINVPQDVVSVMRRCL